MTMGRIYYANLIKNIWSWKKQTGNKPQTICSEGFSSMFTKVIVSKGLRPQWTQPQIYPAFYLSYVKQPSLYNWQITTLPIKKCLGADQNSFDWHKLTLGTGILYRILKYSLQYFQELVVSICLGVVCCRIENDYNQDEGENFNVHPCIQTN